MKKSIAHFIAAAVVASASSAYATNGDNLEGIGPVSVALGGTGVAAPQDPLSATVVNPAGLAGQSGDRTGEFTIGATLFQPEVKAKITTPAGTLSGGSDDPLSVIPYVGYHQKLNEAWDFGFAIYGVAGLGTDYRGQGWDLDGNPANGYEGDLFVKLNKLKVQPALAYRVNDNLALGAALHGNYSTLDMGQGEVDAYGLGGQLGATYKITPAVTFGASYTLPQKADFDEVYNFDAFLGDTRKDTLTLEAPQTIAGGLAWQINDDLFVEFNVKHFAWSDADGYGDFDWDDQIVYAIGAQYKATEKLALRAGFNYGENPVPANSGWNPGGVTTVQGKQVPTFGYELLRTIGFPAIVESHLTLGFGYQLSDTLTLNVAYMHAFEKTLTNPSAGDAIIFESSLVEDSLSLGLAWDF